MTGGLLQQELVDAAWDGKTRQVRSLLERGVNVNGAGGSGNTALIATMVFGDTDLVCLLLDRGADINKTGREGDTALHVAALANRADIVRLLLDRGADITIKNSNGKMALDMAQSRDFAEIVGMINGIEERRRNAVQEAKKKQSDKTAARQEWLSKVARKRPRPT